MVTVIHGWHIDFKSKTACGLNWIYGRHIEGKEPLKMVKYGVNLGMNMVTCKRCLKSRYLRD